MFTLSQIDWVCVCNVLVSLLCLHCYSAWLIGYVCVMFLFLYVFTLSQSVIDWVCVCNVLVSLLCLHCHRAWLIGYVCVMFLFLYCVYTVTEHG